MIRVLVGCCADGSDAESRAVLEYSLRVHASEEVDLTWLMADRSWSTRSWSTPFSGLRWAVPALAGFQGRAIYLDSDVIVQADIAELWVQPMPKGAFALVTGFGRKQRTCVMLLDCAAAQRHLPSLEDLKRGLHRDLRGWLALQPDLTAQIEGRWNCVDLKGSAGVADPAVKIIHYSSLAHQPSHPYAVARMARQGRRPWYDGESFPHWRADLVEYFEALLTEAPIAGYPVEAYQPATPYSPPVRSYRGVRVKGYSV